MTLTTQALQEAVYDDQVDYRAGSPHLNHWRLYDRLVSVLRDHIRGLADQNFPLDVLEIGAGHGGYTEPVLATGCKVTAVEMSRPSLAELNRRFGTNPNFTGVFDPDGSLSNVGGPYSLILCVSVLHHIPDYVSFVDHAIERLAPGGTFLALQDPLWYPRANRYARLVDRGGYYAWRLRQGNAAQGLATLTRRVRGRYDEANPADMVEYHVVRQGVDENALVDRLRPHFTSVDLMPYWSNQLSAGQLLGDRLGLRNTFALVATGRR